MAKHFSPDKLRAIRKQRGYSRQQLADAIVRTKHTVGNYERGSMAPNAETLSRLLDVLECRIEDLYEDVKDSAVGVGGARRTKGSASQGRLLAESAAPSSGKSRRRA